MPFPSNWDPRVLPLVLLPLISGEVLGFFTKHLSHIIRGRFHQLPVDRRRSQNGTSHRKRAIDEINTGQSLEAPFQQKPPRNPTLPAAVVLTILFIDRNRPLFFFP